MRISGREYIQRGAAILLLLFILFDITSTEICGEKLELLGFSDNFIVSVTNQSNHQKTPPLSLEDDGESQHSHSIPLDDDCLCWCPHVLPAMVFNFTSSMIEPTITNPKNILLPSAPPNRLFHPPRFA